MVAPIITGMPIPSPLRKGASPKYPWLQMTPGQAFKFADTVPLSSARSMASQMSATNEVKYAVRQCEDGIYCWRIDGLPAEMQNGSYAVEAKIIDDYQPAPASKVEIVGHGKLVGGKELMPEDDVI